MISSPPFPSGVQPPPPPPSSTLPPPPPPPPPPPSPTTLSTLTSLLSLSSSTLTTFSTLLPLPTPTPTPSLIPCPFNPNHHLPPSSLFSHFLNCPSSPSPLNPTPLLSSLQYPHTLQPPKSTFTSTVSNSHSDLTVSLKDYSGFSSNLFYLDCPGVVTFPYRNLPLKDVILPPVLWLECAEFVGSGFDCDDSSRDMGDSGVRLLASEIWAIRSEFEMWNGFPESYSYCIVRGVLSLSMCGLEDFCIWVVANSPRFGVVVDLEMAGHIVLLVRLCLKAIVREAFRTVYGLMNNKSKEKGWSDKRFCCPVLAQVMTWLASQLAILYGEGNGKSFSICMLKHCLFSSCSSSSFFSVKSEANQSEDLGGGKNNVKPFTTNMENVGKCSASGKIFSCAVFVSQVAAAVAALHERQILEEKIRALWDSRLPSTYQRILEHDNICRTADIERQKRPNYRPLIEHDGLFRQQSHGQDSNKTKTREEILAEERDYKRRRSSYRGKKAKRSTTEVMRDIIEDHMEDLKHAREMECSVNAIEDKQDLEFITYTGHENSTSGYQQTKSSESKLDRGQQRDYGELSGSYSKEVAESMYEFLDNKQHKRKSSSHFHQELDGSTTIDRTKGEQYTRRSADQRSRCQDKDQSVSPDRRRSRYERRDSPRSPHKQKHRYKTENTCSSPDGQSRKHDKNYSSRSPDRKLRSRHRHVSDDQIQDGTSSHISGKSYRKSSERNSSQKEDRGHKIEDRKRSRGKTRQDGKSTYESYDRYSSSCVKYNKFEDRYDPAES